MCISSLLISAQRNSRSLEIFSCLQLSRMHAFKQTALASECYLYACSFFFSIQFLLFSTHSFSIPVFFPFPGFFYISKRVCLSSTVFLVCYINTRHVSFVSNILSAWIWCGVITNCSTRWCVEEGGISLARIIDYVTGTLYKVLN